MNFINLSLFQYFAIFLTLFYCKIPCSLGASLSPGLETDKEALIAIKSQLSILPPDPLSTWDQNSSPCNWTGVECDSRRKRVVGINLSGLRLTGSLSPDVGNLSLLRSLQLQNNLLTGPVPDQIGYLSRLRVLNLSSNLLEGTIPRNISRCQELSILDLMLNAISGEIPEDISFLSGLEVLSLARNRLSGEIPQFIVNITSLKILNLGTNSLMGKIPSDLGRLRNLEELDLSINSLLGTVPLSLYNLSSLVYFGLASNNFWGELPADLGDTLPSLTGLCFCFNEFTGSIPASLHNLTRLEIFRIAHNLLNGPIPPGLGNLPDLVVYNIGFNEIVSSGWNGLSILGSLTNATRLNFLAINFNRLEGVIPESIGNLSKVLSELYMGGNHIYGRIPPAIGNLIGLTLLNLSYASISSEIPLELGQLEGLEVLSLASNQLSGRIPTSLSNLRKLNWLDLSMNDLTGTIPTTFENFQELLFMDLSDNKLSGNIPKEILMLPRLIVFLGLSHNLLTGRLSEEIGRLQSVVRINISHNSLSGNIPDSIGNLGSLVYLSLSNNMFLGQIPDTLGRVRGLEILDLSKNRLSGPIPSSLQNLGALKFLNLSYNNLQGEVPKGGIFASASGAQIEGNPNLYSQLARGSGNRNNQRRIIMSYTCSIIVAVVVICICVWLFFRFSTKHRGKIQPLVFESFGKQQVMISYAELCKATNNFAKENVIGLGSFGLVYKGHIWDGMAVAVKVLDRRITGSWKSFLAECVALRVVRHRNLVKLMTVCSSLDFRNVDFLALVYELMPNGSLADWITGRRRKPTGDKLNFVDRLNVAIDTANALNYLHHESEAQVVHSDLKPSNVLLDSDMTAKLGDFGLASLLANDANKSVASVTSTLALKGSIGYIPPEYGMGGKLSTAGDVYSFGIMLLELLTGKSPTDERFKEGLSLKKWVQMAFPADIEQVVDDEMILGYEDVLEEEGDPVDPLVRCDCVARAMGVALSCVADLPDTRVTMRDVLFRLQSIKASLLRSE